MGRSAGGELVTEQGGCGIIPVVEQEEKMTGQP